MRVGVSIEKETSFRGGVQPFANTYYYEAPLAETATGEWTDLVDKLVAKEKTIHSTGVTFTRGRLWRADGTKSENIMIVDKVLTGTGSALVTPRIDKERALLIQIRAGFDSRGRPVRLKKWFHVVADGYAGSSFTDSQTLQTAQLTAAQLTALAAYGDYLKNVAFGTGSAVNAELVGPTGRQVTGASAGHPYLEHHQLGDQWRG